MSGNYFFREKNERGKSTKTVFFVLSVSFQKDTVKNVSFLFYRGIIGFY
jgi:hypothetical protein